MADEFVLDASVAAKCFFTEDGSDEARALVFSGARFVAPDLIFVEMASIGARHVRRGLVPQALAAEALDGLAELLDETAPLFGLAPRAFVLAAAHGVSAYDGCYLALAEQRNAQVVTADRKLIERANAEGLGGLVQSLT
jgi:predicted nucleic acid-binding protein